MSIETRLRGLEEQATAYQRELVQGFNLSRLSSDQLRRLGELNAKARDCSDLSHMTDDELSELSALLSAARRRQPVDYVALEADLREFYDGRPGKCPTPLPPQGN